MKDYIENALRSALASMEGVPEEFAPELSVPASVEHGDLATNSALRLARHLRKAPRQIAEDIVARLHSQGLDAHRISACEIAGPGFINFRFSIGYLYKELEDILSAGAAFGRTRGGEGRRALVEFVSANPTGPLTVGHGRNAVLGDTIANLLEWTGFEVTREYYFNDAGRQMRVLGSSVRARYEEILAFQAQSQKVERDDALARHLARYGTKHIDGGAGKQVEVAESFPEDGYRGAYIVNIARALVEKYGGALLGEGHDELFMRTAKEAILADIESTLRRLNIKMDSFFNERTLYSTGAVRNVLEALRKEGCIYKSEGAEWFRTSTLGKDKDTVLVKSSGEPTYRLPDIAYHRDKFERGYDVMVNVFGADHIATYPDIFRGLRVLGYDADRVEVIIYQFVTLMRGGEEVRMSTRKANFVTLDELLDDVGDDVTRFFFQMRSANKHLEFDLDLAKEASDKNPVFYLQYAHARICSILRKAEETGFAFDAEADLTLLTHEAEVDLIKAVALFPETLRRIAQAREPHRLGMYLRSVAEAFTRFYHGSRILGEERRIATARMALAHAARLVLRNGLSVLGISAPERM